ncbi:ribonuclease 3-like protein 2 [Cryptomeria japonica]|uniref:ribonuclease 3-like protein 2 n=1 Tax=Cryptomeria japonica TaxID=3369 RepID=UPI0027DA03F5|nr:ribonuclease 3-like protein 2 [Cryptomeria japonica]
MDEQLDDKCLEEKIDQIFSNSEHKILLDRLSELEEVLNYKFNKRNLIEEALTHSSVILNFSTELELLGLNECEISKHLKIRGLYSYERLEFLGDAILGQLVTVYLYNPDMQPGILTRLRSANVRNETLAHVAVKHGLFSYLRFESTDLKEAIEKFTPIAKNEVKHHRSYHSNAPKALADIVESIAGAVFVDSENSVDKVWKLVQRHLRGTQLQSIRNCVKRRGNPFEYFTYIVDNLLATVDVFIDGELMGSGENEIKKLAKRAAARDTFLNLKVEKRKPLLQPLVDPKTLERHPVAELQELCQREGKSIEYFSYIVDNLLVTVDVFIDGELVASGENEIKEVAKRAAVTNAFLNLKEYKSVELAQGLPVPGSQNSLRECTPEEPGVSVDLTVREGIIT